MQQCTLQTQTVAKIVAWQMTRKLKKNCMCGSGDFKLAKPNSRSFAITLQKTEKQPNDIYLICALTAVPLFVVINYNLQIIINIFALIPTQI